MKNYKAVSVFIFRHKNLLLSLWLTMLITACDSVNQTADNQRSPKNSKVTLKIVYSPEISSYVNEIKNIFESAAPELSDHSKIAIEAIEEPGVTAAAKLAKGELKTEAWIAPSSSLVNYTNSNLINLGARHTNCLQLFSTPVVLAAASANLDSFQAQDQKVSWSNIAANRLNYSNKIYNPSSFVFSHAWPETTSGFTAYLQLAYLAAVSSGDSLSLEAFQAANTIKQFKAYQSVVSSYSRDDQSLLARTAAAGTKRVRFAITTEQQVAKYNAEHSDGAADGDFKLVALYPEEGSVWQDYSFCIADADWVNPAKRAALNIFSNFLNSANSQQPASKLGFRPARAGQTLDSTLTSKLGINPLLPAKSLRPVSGDVVSHLLDHWKSFQRPAANVIVLDTSGSMEGPSLSLSQEAIRNYIARIAPSSKLALVTFSSQPNLLANFEAPLDSLMAKLDAITSQGGSAVFDSLKLAIEMLTAPDFVSYRKNIILVSDGGDLNSELSLQGILNFINEKLIRHDMNLYVVALDSAKQESLEELRRLARASNGLYQQGPPSSIVAMFDEIMSSSL